MEKVVDIIPAETTFNFQKRGYWIKHSYEQDPMGNLWFYNECSVCHKTVIYNYNYCPFCLSNMNWEVL